MIRLIIVALLSVLVLGLGLVSGFFIAPPALEPLRFAKGSLELFSGETSNEVPASYFTQVVNGVHQSQLVEFRGLGAEHERYEWWSFVLPKPPRVLMNITWNTKTGSDSCQTQVYVEACTGWIARDSGASYLQTCHGREGTVPHKFTYSIETDAGTKDVKEFLIFLNDTLRYRFAVGGIAPQPLRFTPCTIPAKK